MSFDALSLVKDVDGLGSESRARLGTVRQVHAPATALGIAMLLEYGGFTASRERGTHVAIVGKGRLCGSPLATLLNAHPIAASVTLCDVFTRNAATICRGVDVLVSAVGGGQVVRQKASILQHSITLVAQITPEHVNPAAETVVIDVGGGDVWPEAGNVRFGRLCCCPVFC